LKTLVKGLTLSSVRLKSGIAVGYDKAAQHEEEIDEQIGTSDKTQMIDSAGDVQANDSNHQRRDAAPPV
jgi:hypothetical protein